MHQWWVTAHLRGSIFQTLATLRRWFLASLRRHSEKLSYIEFNGHHSASQFPDNWDPRKESQKKKHWPIWQWSRTSLSLIFGCRLLSRLHPASPSEPPAVYAIRSDAIFMPTNPTKQISQEAWHFLPLMVSAASMSKKIQKGCHKKMETFFRDVEEWRWCFQIPSCSFYFGMLPCAGLGSPLFILTPITGELVAHDWLPISVHHQFNTGLPPDFRKWKDPPFLMGKSTITIYNYGHFQ